MICSQSFKMSFETIPKYEVYTKKKLISAPVKTLKSKRRLVYRTFKEAELEQLDEVLHNNNIDLEGITIYLAQC